jgi:hypothetical protein
LELPFLALSKAYVRFLVSAENGGGIGSMVLAVWRSLQIVLTVALAGLQFFPLTAAAQPSQRPAYISADAGPVTQAFGAAMAQRIFSDEFRSTRATAVLSSAREIPGFNCPADPVVSLELVVPYPVRPGAISWLERWRIRCDVPVQRNFIAVLENNYLRIGQLLPGASLADPALQRDTLPGVISAAVAGRPSGCSAPGRVINMEVNKMPERTGGPWTEVWTVMQCEAKLPLTVTFTPAPTGGVTWAVGPARRP